MPNRYACRAVGENNWTLVRADSLEQAASKYVMDSEVLSDFFASGSVSIFVKVKDNESSVYKFEVICEFKVVQTGKYES